MNRPLSSLDRRLLETYQRDFPLVEQPFALMAQELGVGEEEVLSALARLRAEGVVSRVGVVFQPLRVGVSTLAAMAVPPRDLERVAARVNACPEVNHNYERENDLNLWFVLTAPDQAGLRQAIDRLEEETGLTVLTMPLVEDFHIDLGFPLQWHG